MSRLTGADGLAASVLAAAAGEASVALDTAVGKVLAMADARSSGPFSLAELARRDHPYAKRHARPLLDPTVVNEQTGAFRAAWRRRRIDRLHGQVVNDNPVADWLEHGTSTMHARRVGESVEADAERAGLGLHERS